MSLIRLALDAGFSRSQAEFLDQHFALVGHTHDTIDITGLDDMVDAAVDDNLEEFLGEVGEEK